MRPLRLEDTMPRKKPLKSFHELDQATRERFFDPPKLTLVEPKKKPVPVLDVAEPEVKVSPWKRLLRRGK